MNKTGLMILAVSFLLGGVMNVAFADETVSEGIAANAKGAKRGIKKAANRAEELFCNSSDLECAARKAKNRAVEAGEATVDGAVEIKNKID